MTQQRLFLILVVLSFVSFGSWMFFVEEVRAMNVKILDHEYEQLKAQLGQAETAANSLQSVEEAIAAEQTWLSAFNASLLPVDSVSRFTDELSQLGQAYEVDVIEAKPNLRSILTDDSDRQVYPLEISLRMEGGFLNVAKYLEAVYQNETAFLMDSLSFRRIEGGNSAVQVNLNAKIYSKRTD